MSKAFWVRCVSVAILCCCCSLAHAFLEFNDLDDIQVAAWNGSGGLQGSDEYCVISKRRANSRRRVAYDVAAYGPADAAGNFVLASETNPNQTIAITLTWTGNNGSYLMSNYAQTGYITPRQNGALTCAEANSRARIAINVASSELASAQAGIYSGSFRIDSLQLGSPSQYVIQTIRIEIPELYQISDLGSIDLGSFDGVSGRVGEDQLCVFRNGNGTYGLSASGGVNPTEPFLLIDGSVSIPFTLELSGADGTFLTVEPGVQIDGLIGHSQQNCGGATNASVRVSVNQAALTSAPPGNYRGIVYITASPE